MVAKHQRSGRVSFFHRTPSEEYTCRTSGGWHACLAISSILVSETQNSKDRRSVLDSDVTAELSRAFRFGDDWTHYRLMRTTDLLKIERGP